MTAYLDRLLDERASLTGVMNSLRDKAADANRDLSEPERSEVARLQERCVEIDGQLTEHHEQNESARAHAELLAKIEKSRPANGAGGGAVPAAARAAGGVEFTRLGQTFVDSEEFRSYAGRGSSGRVALEGYIPAPMEARAAIMTANLAIQPFILPPGEVVSRAPLLEVVNRVQVSSGVVEWVEIGGDPIAAVVAEGALKPEASLTFTPASAALDTIAHWVQITRQALDDAPYVRSLVEGKLRRGLMAKVNADVGALLIASAATIPDATGADLTAAIRVGIGKVEGAGYQPNAIVLNPADYAALDIAAAEASNAGPTRRTQFWGLTTVSDPAIPAGKAYVGDFQEAITLFDRGVSDVFVSDSHADFFLRNILVILAEARVKTAMTDPLALAECTATP